jgi:hypothetical protein
MSTIANAPQYTSIVNITLTPITYRLGINFTNAVICNNVSVNYSFASSAAISKVVNTSGCFIWYNFTAI